MPTLLGLLEIEQICLENRIHLKHRAERCLRFSPFCALGSIQPSVCGKFIEICFRDQFVRTCCVQLLSKLMDVKTRAGQLDNTMRLVNNKCQAFSYLTSRLMLLCGASSRLIFTFLIESFKNFPLLFFSAFLFWSQFYADCDPNVLTFSVAK